MDNKKFIKVETAKKTREQIDKENAERAKKERAQKMKKSIVTLIIVVGLSLLIGYLMTAN